MNVRQLEIFLQLEISFLSPKYGLRRNFSQHNCCIPLVSSLSYYTLFEKEHWSPGTLLVPHPFVASRQYGFPGQYLLSFRAGSVY